MMENVLLMMEAQTLPLAKILMKTAKFGTVMHTGAWNAMMALLLKKMEHAANNLLLEEKNLTLLATNGKEMFAQSVLTDTK